MDSADHFRHLAEFIKGVDLAGGTTPHVAMTVAAMDRLEDPLEKLWFAGCYMLTYNWPTAERIFQEWRPYEFEAEPFLDWVTANWALLPLRKERKAVYRKPFFTECARTYLEFTDQVRANLECGWDLSYEQAFTLFNRNVKYAGRYIGIRWLEVMRRAFPEQCGSWHMTDIRADGGEHPRKAMALIYPDRADVLLGGNSRAELNEVDKLAALLRVDLDLDFGMDVNYYELQSLLCEYKQSVLRMKQYPGKSIDTEMDYFRIAGMESSWFWDIRRECFPEWSLGEVQGWGGVRTGLGPVLVNHGYTWSDAIYDWAASKDDLAVPVFRNINVQSLL